MNLIESLMVALVISILASIALPVLTNAYAKTQWHILVAKSRENNRIEAALIDEPNRFDQARFEFLISTPVKFK